MAQRVKPEIHQPDGVANRRGISIERLFTRAGIDPFSEVDWELRSAIIAGEDGRVVFEQRDIEVPRDWSQTAANVVVSKYFRGGSPGSSRRETSARQLISRVADTITTWGEKQHYFANDADGDAFRAELIYLLVHQIASFNSPVYFNVGIEPRPQCSACFILKVDDNM
ncbi:MAG: vitamin B12-dependent ribonucleotide reductase, partial [Deltaproteobacteria bacterium]|nr:vitamin B12-dependent ribonucleotide reductase [Deltaproteobacteria bacterium]